MPALNSEIMARCKTHGLHAFKSHFKQHLFVCVLEGMRRWVGVGQALTGA